MITVLGWTAALLCGIGWFWQFVRTEESHERLAKAKLRIDELKKGVHDATMERDEAFRRGREREAQAKKFGHESVLRGVLPLADDFVRALNPAVARNHKALLRGVDMMHRQLLDMLNRQGVEVFESVGETFDPREHEAVDKMPTKDYDPDTVIAQQAPGYRLHGRLLRAARVVVSVPPHGSEKSSEKSKK